MASLSPAERQRLEEEEQHRGRLARREERARRVSDLAIANFRRLGLRWSEVVAEDDDFVDEDRDGNGILFEEDFIVMAALRVVRVGDDAPDYRRDVLLYYLRHMYLRVQQWGDFEVWRHLRRQDMLENPRTVRLQIQRIFQGHVPVDSVRERELFDEWRPQNAQAMNEMWTVFRRYAVLYAIGMIEEEMEWTDFEIWRHFRRRDLLTDPNQVILQYTRLQQGIPLVDEDEEMQLFDDFIQNNEEEMMNMRERFDLVGLDWINLDAFDLRLFHRQNVDQPVHRDL
jgi:hypothetical protein